jgi:hypothetical protein
MGDENAPKDILSGKVENNNYQLQNQSMEISETKEPKKEEL